jgi:hypothetical protein
MRSGSRRRSVKCWRGSDNRSLPTSHTPTQAPPKARLGRAPNRALTFDGVGQRTISGYPFLRDRLRCQNQKRSGLCRSTLERAGDSRDLFGVPTRARLAGEEHGPCEPAVVAQTRRSPSRLRTMSLGSRMRKACFLCEPDPSLIYASDTEFFAMCGYGPIVPGYSIIATKGHVRSCADLSHVKKGRLETFVKSISDLISIYGECVITEHGRVPICNYLNDNADAHCYHAHILLFPGSPSILNSAEQAAVCQGRHRSLPEALSLAESLDHYVLLAEPTQSDFRVFGPPDPPTRQFARLLVATEIGRPQAADWRMDANRDAALRYAVQFREMSRM